MIGKFEGRYMSEARASNDQHQVSVVIPTYNRADYICETIDSVFAGNEGLNIEILVVDDGSTDSTLDVLKRYNGRIVLLTQENQGAPAARNRGFAESSGRYVKFLDSDDLLEPGIIKEQYEHLESTGADVSYGDWRYFGDPGDARNGQVVKLAPTKDAMKAILIDWWVSPFGYLFRKETISGIAWDPELRALQDFDYVLRVAIEGARFVYLSKITGSYRIGTPGNISRLSSQEYSRIHCRILEKVTRILEKNGQLSFKRKQLIAENYWDKSRLFLGVDNNAYNETVKKIYRLNPFFFPVYFKGRILLKIMIAVIGVKPAEAAVRVYRRIKRRGVVTDSMFFLKFLFRQKYYRKRYLDSSKKASVVILNWNRSRQLYRIVGSLRESRIVDDIFIWNNNHETVLFPMRFLPEVKVIHSPVNTLHGRWLAGLMVKKDSVYMQDDDLLFLNEGIELLYDEWEKDPFVIHGLYGRGPDARNNYNLSNDANPQILTTKCIMFHKKNIPSFFSNLLMMDDDIAELTKKNGEDILFSYCAIKNTSRNNKAHSFLKRYALNLDESDAICSKRFHYRDRTMVMRECIKKLC
jgi:glycosyltransferase involved in cell wall biosynthesis